MRLITAQIATSHDFMTAHGAVALDDELDWVMEDDSAFIPDTSAQTVEEFYVGLCQEIRAEM